MARRFLPLVCLLALLSAPLFADTAASLPPFDTATRTGTLDDGIRFFILKNAKPENRVDMRLVVQAGSIQETPAESGLAHLIEHMEFEGTGHFASQEIVSFIESNGMSFGGDLNAQTSYTDTQYYLELPADKPEAIKKGLAILEDWAHGPKVDDENLAKEKKIVAEENRVRYQSAQARAMIFASETLLAGSAYANHEPIGTMEAVQGFTPQDIKRFVDAWYSPKSMSVIVIGSLDPEAMEKELRELFKEPFANASRPEPSPPPALPAVASDTVSFFKDHDLSSNYYSWWKVESPPAARAEDVERIAMVNMIAFGALNKRLGDLARQPESPVKDAGANAQLGFGKTIIYSGGFTPRDGKAPAAIATFLTELKRAAVYGITKSEFDLGLKSYIDSNDAELSQSGNATNSSKAGQIASWIVNGISFAFTKEVYDYRRSIAAAITREEVNASLAKYVLPSPARMVVRTMDKPSDMPPSAEDLAAIKAKALAAAVQPYAERKQRALMPAIPKKGKILKTEEIAGTPFSRWTLSNGIQVYLYKNSLTKNDFRLRGYAPGGLSTVGDAEYQVARYGRSIFGKNGAGDLSQSELEDFLNGKKARVSFGFDDADAIVSGTSDPADPDDMEKFFQLLNTQLKGFRRDDAAEKTALANIREDLVNNEKKPERVYQDALNRLITNGAPRTRLFTPDRIKELSADKAAALAKKYYGNPSAFTFVMTGDYDEAALKALVETYLASLPSVKAAPLAAKDLGIRPAAGPITRIVRAGKDNKAVVNIFMETPFPYDASKRELATVLEEALNIRMRELLRQEKGGTYGASVGIEIDSVPYPHATTWVGFTCSLEGQDALAKAAIDELRAVESGLLDDDTFAKALEIRKQAEGAAQKTDLYWMDALFRALERGEDLADIAKRPAFYEAVSKADVMDLAARILKPEEAIVAILDPEAKGSD